MKRIVLVFIINLMLCVNGYGQVNLVANPSFEDTIRCPNNVAGMILPSACKNWYDPDSASSDYFNACASIQSFVNVPNAYLGWQYARTGVAYAGFRTFGTGEYLQEKLDSILYQNHEYCIEFYVSLANKFNIASNNIGIYISDAPPIPPPFPPNPYSNCVPQINDTTIITDTLGWTKISGTYIAHGGEKYITIGNFYTDSQTDTVWVAHQNGGNGSYYYIDDVSIVDCTPGLGISELTTSPEILISSNPATNSITITSSTNIKEIKLINLLGEVVSASTPAANQSTIDISNLSKGIYFVEITDEKKNVVNRKIVVQ